MPFYNNYDYYRKRRKEGFKREKEKEKEKEKVKVKRENGRKRREEGRLCCALLW